MYQVLLNEIAKLDGMGLIPDINFDSGAGPWWKDIIQQGISTTPAIIAASKGARGQGIPGYPGAGGPTVYGYSPIGGQYQPGINSDGTLSVTPRGIKTSGELNISTNMLVIGGLGLAVIFLMSKKR